MELPATTPIAPRIESERAMKLPAALPAFKLGKKSQIVTKKEGKVLNRDKPIGMR
jgi:hypothetical protein